MATLTINRTGPILGALAALPLAISTATHAHAQPSTPTGPTAATAPDAAASTFDAERIGAWFVRRLTQSREFDLSYTMWRWRETRLPTMTDDEFESLAARVEGKPQHPDSERYRRESGYRTSDGQSVEHRAWFAAGDQFRYSSGKLDGTVEYAVGGQTRWQLHEMNPENPVPNLIIADAGSEPEGVGIGRAHREALRPAMMFLSGLISNNSPFGAVENLAVTGAGDGTYEITGDAIARREIAERTKLRLPPTGVRAPVTTTGTGSEPLILEIIYDRPGNPMPLPRFTALGWSFPEALGARVLDGYEQQRASGVPAYRYELLEVRRIDRQEFAEVIKPPLDGDDPVVGEVEIYQIADFRGTDGSRPAIRDVSDSQNNGDASESHRDRLGNSPPTGRRTARTSPHVYIWGGAGVLVLVLIAGSVWARTRR